MKWIVLILIMALVAYPVIELTRVILVAGRFYWPEETGMFAVELAVIWTGYLAIIPLYLVSVRFMWKISNR